MKSTFNIQETRITSSFFAWTSPRYGISETWFFLSWIRAGGVQVLCLSQVPSVILSIKRCCSRTPAPKILSVDYILTVSNNANMLKFLDSIGLHLDCFLSVFLPVDLSAQRRKKVAINISANHMSTCHRYHIDLSTTPVMSPSHYMDLRGMMVDQASDHSSRLRSNFFNKMWSKWVFFKDTSGQFPHMFTASKPGVLNKTLFILRQNIIFSRP